MKKHFHFLFIATFWVFTFSRCSPEKIKPVVLVAEPEFVNEEVVELIKKQLSDFDTLKNLVIADDSLFATKLIIEFYKINKFNVTWSDKGKHSKQSDSLLSLIKNSDDYGLISSDYHFNKIESLIKKERDPKTKKYDAVKISEVDILLTDAFFTFAVHVNKGRLNIDSLIREWKIIGLILPRTTSEREPETDLVAILNGAIKQNIIRETIDSLEPKNKQYQALKFALKNFKFEFRDSEWDSLASRESDSTTFNERLKKRLIASHDYADIIENSDSIKLEKAIKNFQCRHNLTEDGKIGKLTFKALQRSKRDYVHQIQMNMERWRNYYSPYEKQFVWVNIPKYEMQVIEEDTLVMKSRVIVGQPDHRTPVLKSTIRYFLIYPYWTVPLSIATKEILPILKRDTSYLRRKNFEVLDYRNRVVETPINWKKYNKNYFPWKLRQRTGDENSLGILKFNFENKYGVYLHDTDNRRLFKREMRAMSHGCVRLERFIDFAKFLIRDDKKNYPLDSLKMDLLKEEQKYVYIKHPIPIYINYFTTEVDNNDELFFFIDVYKKDEKMLKSLYYLR
ncbi:MAG: L,D-transpeptidase family protein [Bacteroidetes bacterium]|nr:L,D-transpeptidase family protein [Bacteroidota bacterium]